MSSNSSDRNLRSQRLAAVIADYLQAGDRGERPDPEAVIAAHPDLSESLQGFFQVHRRLQELAPEPGAAGCDPVTTRWPTENSRFGSRDSLNPHGQASASTRADSELFPSLVHRVFGDYEILEEIDRGGMGIVYKARQRSLDRIVALKMIRSGQLAGADDVQRFHAEAAAAAQLDHPGIVPIYEVGQIDGVDYFSMGFIAGGTLSGKLADGPLPPRLAAEYVMKIADAVAYAHAHGIVHRDLKPGNVLLDMHGQPKITDFGLAKRLESESHLTATGQVLGTPAYMSPEQAAGQKQAATVLADVYSLGAILYHLLTGYAPFVADNPIDIMLQVLDRDPDPPTSRNRNVPPVLEKICRHAMEKQPSDRYPSAHALADDLRCFLKDEPIRWPQESLRGRLKRWWRREPILIAHWVAIAAVLVISWSHKWLTNTDLTYILWHSFRLIVWACLSFLLQKIMNQPRWRDRACIAWGVLDVSLFTYVLNSVMAPRDVLLVGYSVLIASSGLFLRVRYVNMMTTACLLGYLILLLLHPDEMLVRPQYSFIFVACLAVLGALVGVMVKRVRTLREYYEIHE